MLISYKFINFKFLNIVLKKKIAEAPGFNKKCLTIALEETVLDYPR